MATNVIMPRMGLTMTEGTIGKWLKHEGDRVEKGEPLLEIMNDKINFQYESPASGILRKILHNEGETVELTTTIAIIAEEGEALPEVEATRPEASPETRPSPVVEEQIKAPSKRIMVSPLARKIAQEKGIDLSTLTGSGPGGRIIEVDVMRAAEKAIAKAVERPLPSPEPSTRLIPLKGIRKIVAKRMTESFQTIPHFYLSLEIDMTACLALREQIKSEIEKRAMVRLTLTDILVKVVASALRAHPMLNSRIEGDHIRLMEEVHIGVAIALEDGLIVPVVRHADRKSMTEIAVTLRDLTQRAREGKLALEDVAGGTFTLSNMGMLGIDKFNPIINPPECSILGVGRTIEKTVVQGGEIKIRPMAWLNLSSDHRIVDGAIAAHFLTRIKTLIENPAFLLI